MGKKSKRIILWIIVLAIIGGGLFIFLRPGQSEDERKIKKAVANELGMSVSSVKKEDMEELTTLNLSGLKLTDISSLADYPSLKKLNLSENSLKDITVLSELTDLVELDISNNKIDDLTPLKGSDELEVLIAKKNKIFSLFPLAGLEKLQRVDLAGNKVNSIDPLTECPELLYLDVTDNKLQEISAAASFVKLQTLYVKDNQIYDLRPLKNIPEIDMADPDTELDAENKEAVVFKDPAFEKAVRTELEKDMGKITAADLLSITKLKIDDASLQSLDDVRKTPNLQTLVLNKTGVTDISPLSCLSQLSSIAVQDSKLTEVDALAEIPSLTSIELRNNNIADVSALFALPTLSYLDVSGNPITDYSKVPAASVVIGVPEGVEVATPTPFEDPTPTTVPVTEPSPIPEVTGAPVPTPTPVPGVTKKPTPTPTPVPKVTKKPTPTPAVFSYTNLDKVKVGNTVTMGTYEQDNKTKNGAEKIEWLVLDVQEDKVLLLSKYCIDALAYNDELEDTCWEFSSVRSFLRNKFYYNSFTDEEREKIDYVKNVNADSADYNTEAGADTSDTIFLLSEADINKYLLFDKSLKAKATKYAQSRGVVISTEKNSYGLCEWWLRTPGERLDTAATITSKGWLGTKGKNVYSVIIGLRPALWVTR